MRVRGIFRKALSACMALGAVTLGSAIVSPTAGASSSASGGSSTVTWAEVPMTTPNYILPYYPGALCSVANIDQFQYLMFRPLYYFGNDGTPAVDSQLSLGETPKYSNGDKTVTITLKNYKWSNGETVNGADVLFFMNIYQAEKANFCGYVPGLMPDNLTNVTASGQTVTFTMNRSFSPSWFTANELSQITPMPEAWDITTAGAPSGSGKCAAGLYGQASTVTACTAVYTFLSGEAGYDASNPQAANNSLPTYATNPLWQVVDGPWRLSAFNADGNVTFIPNTKYSGPIKPTIKKFEELPYTSSSSEFNALVGGDLDVGALPSENVTSPALSPTVSGANNPRLAGFNLNPLYTWGINYFPMNFNSTGDGGQAGAIISQAYFREAVQSMVNEPQFIDKVYKGYAVPTYGPVPVEPANSLASPQEKSNPWPYSPSKAKSLLTSNGWKVVPGGTDTCIKPGTAKGDCGANITAGAKLAFTIEVASGTAALTKMVTAEKSAWATVGINMTLSFKTFNTVIGDAVACSPGPSCTWEFEDWGGGWVYAPDTYPSGEDLWGKGAAANYGSYYDATNQAMINATDFTNVTLTKWENYLAKQVPDVWQPNPASELTEVKKGLSGVTPQNVYWDLLPEQWRWSK